MVRLATYCYYYKINMCGFPSFFKRTVFYFINAFAFDQEFSDDLALNQLCIFSIRFYHLLQKFFEIFIL